MRNAALAFFLVLIPCSLHAQDKPLTIEQVRELLNKSK